MFCVYINPINWRTSRRPIKLDSFFEKISITWMQVFPMKWWRYVDVVEWKDLKAYIFIFKFRVKDDK